MAKKLKYRKSTHFGYNPQRKRDTDLGIDLPARQNTNAWLIEPGEIKVVDTGLQFKFPVFSWIQRKLVKLIFGIDITGVGGLVWPRSRNDYAVLAGVIDTGYRGKVKVKIYNSSKEAVLIYPGDLIAQMVPILTLNIPLFETDHIETSTSRGTSGGINQ